MLTRSRTGFGLLGGCLGVVLVLGVLGAARVLGAHRPGTVSSTCAGAPFQVTLATGPEEWSAQVTARVVVHDDDARSWQVLWRGFSYPIATITIDDDPRLGQAFRPFGDLDDGTERPVWIRPAGAESWCKVTAHLD